MTVHAGTHPSFDRVDHRPWPVPDTPWVGRQSWLELLFAHWPVDADLLRPLIPKELELQEFDGAAWIGVVPFRMAGVAMRPFPEIPGLSAFPELNVRTYVNYKDRPGVWFFSLDAANRIAVWAARAWFCLPYFHAKMSCARNGNEIQYSSRRTSAQDIQFQGSYEPTSDVYESIPGTLEHWLAKRYCLYSQNSTGKIFRAEVHHKPWPLQQARATIECNDMAKPFGIPFREAPALLHYSARLDVAVWTIHSVT